MERLLIHQLLKWKESTHRKPLVLEGARQVGKTWLLREFGKKYFKDVCYINFEQKDRLESIFAGDLSPQFIIEQLSIYHGKPIKPQTTLIVFDEVQEMPRALTSLKYFCEEAPEYAICCAGSLLGIALHEGTSFPVGKTDFLHLYPLTFKEFLLANGEQMLVDYIQQGNRNVKAFEPRLIDYLKRYMIVGGMPAVVNEWLDTKDFTKVEKIQKQLIAAYQKDFSKHAPHQMVEKIRYVWNSITSQLAKENKKFIYGAVKEGARAKDFELAIEWLKDAGLIYKVNRCKKALLPLAAYEDFSAFKLFLSDVGLMGAMSNIPAQSLLEGNVLFSDFKGALTEQYVLQQLKEKSSLSIYYWSAENSRGEIDFLVQDEERIIPIEVKAEENLQAKSLRVFVERNQGLKGMRLSMSPYREQDWLANYPLYSVSAIFD
mgnify:CR=1 FL=1